MSLTITTDFDGFKRLGKEFLDALPTATQEEADAGCRSIGKHNKAWIVYRGESPQRGKFDNYFFLDADTRDAFRKQFEIPAPTSPCHFGQ